MDPLVITWCNFTDAYARRSIQGPTGGSSVIGSFGGIYGGAPGLPALPPTDIQKRLEDALRVRFRAYGGPENATVGKLIELFGTPGTPRGEDAPPPDPTAVPDVFPYGFWCTGWPYDEPFIRKTCAGLTRDEIEKHMPGMARAVQNASKAYGSEGAAWRSLEVAGVITWLPLNMEEIVADNVPTPTGILWRADILADLGLPVPVTIEEWGEVFAGYRARHPGTPAWNDDRNLWSWRAVYTATGVPFGNWILEGDHASPWWTRPEVRRALGVLQAWHREGYLGTDSPERGGEEAFVTGKSIVADLATWESGDWVVDGSLIPGSAPYRTRELNPLARFVLSPPPRFGEGTAGLRLPLAHRSVLWGQFAFAKRLEQDRDKLHRILEAIDRIGADRATYLLAFHGVEGRDWKWREAGGVAFPEPLLDDTRRQGLGLGRYWTQALYGAFAGYRMDPRLPESRAAHATGRGGLYAEPGHRWNQDPRARVSAQDGEAHQRLFERERALYEVFEKAQGAIVRNGEPLSRFDEYLAWWREHGGPEVEAEVNRLMDRSETG